MIVFIAGLILGILGLLWLWKVPVRRLVEAMKEGGSSAFEAYSVIAFLAGGLALTIYIIVRII